MRIAKDIIGPNGEAAFRKGQVIDEGVLETLRGLDLARVPVEGDKSAVSEEALLTRIESYVSDFFQYVDPDSEAFIELYRLVAERVWDAVGRGWDIPCRSERTARNVEHMRDLFFKGNASVEDLVRHETSLASFPGIYVRLKKVLDSPTSSAADVAKVVTADPGVSSKLLTLVNSPFFGLAGKVDSVSHAVSLVGLREVATIALGISTIDYFKDIPKELVDLCQFWRHSLSCAVFAKLIAKAVGVSSDRLFTAGLLHDCGRLIMYKNLPYASVQSLIHARGDSVPLVEAEREVLGFDHQEVASLLLEQWGFPDDLKVIISNHHNPERAADSKEAAIVQLADNMANAAAISSENMFVLPGMSDAAWSALGFPKEKFVELLGEHDRDIDDITKVFV
ncbi:MAG: HDOD domain-containing protein [Desulfovibrionaceae bacterium]|nr:HDOD domain-containing protein [Desulfovibrionaceae bacterium]